MRCGLATAEALFRPKPRGCPCLAGRRIATGTEGNRNEGSASSVVADGGISVGRSWPWRVSYLIWTSRLKIVAGRKTCRLTPARAVGRFVACRDGLCNCLPRRPKATGTIGSAICASAAFMPSSDDPLSVFQLLARAGVPFVIIGGHAVTFHVTYVHRGRRSDF